jgi:hypothetical protein
MYLHHCIYHLANGASSCDLIGRTKEIKCEINGSRLPMQIRTCMIQHPCISPTFETRELKKLSLRVSSDHALAVDVWHCKQGCSCLHVSHVKLQPLLPPDAPGKSTAISSLNHSTCTRSRATCKYTERIRAGVCVVLVVKEWLWGAVERSRQYRGPIKCAYIPVSLSIWYGCGGGRASLSLSEAFVSNFL